jgi:hypothetical protein
VTIPRVWSTGAPGIPVDANQRPVLRAADLAQLDGNIQRAVDKSVGGGTVAGPLSLTGKVRVGSAAAPFAAFVIAAGATATTATGGRIVATSPISFYDPGSGLAAPRTRVVVGSLLECFNSLATQELEVPAGVSPGLLPPISALSTVTEWSIAEAINHGWCLKTAGRAPGDGLFGALLLPLTRVHDGGFGGVGGLGLSILTSFSVTFYVNSARTVLPTVYPAVALYQIDPFTGEVLSLTPGVGPTSFAPAASLAAYKNSGHANALTITPTANNAIDLSRYSYLMAMTDEDYGAGNTDVGLQNEFGAYSMTHLVYALGHQ